MPIWPTIRLEKTMLPKGVITALATPMNDDTSIDWKSWRKLLDFQTEQIVDGVVVLGTTGESPTIISAKERIRLIGTAVQRFKRSPMTHVFVGTGTNCTKTTIEETKLAKQLGADAALVVTPYYNKPNRSGIIEHFKAVADVGLPIIVYDIKGRTGRQIELDEFRKICEHQNVMGIKAASGDLEQIKTLIREIAYPIKQTGRDFYVWSGDDNLTIPVCEAGGDGVISVASNLIPEQVRFLAFTSMALSNITRVSPENEDKILALNRIARDTGDFMKKLFIETNPVPIKYAMHKAKPQIMQSPAVRLPLGPLSSANALDIEKAIAQISSYIR